MSGQRLGIKSAKGTSTSGFITKSNVNVKNKKQIHRYLHESDMEQSEEEDDNNRILTFQQQKKINNRTLNLKDILNIKKEQINQTSNSNTKAKVVHKYVNKMQDYIEDNYIELGDKKQEVLDNYKIQLVTYFGKEGNQKEQNIPFSHDLLNYKKQLGLLVGEATKKSLNVKESNIGQKTKHPLEY
ncbi:hypothetical protein QEN19_001397 [Hanseniaspora menglaensis]